MKLNKHPVQVAKVVPRISPSRSHALPQVTCVGAVRIVGSVLHHGVELHVSSASKLIVKVSACVSTLLRAARRIQVPGQPPTAPPLRKVARGGRRGQRPPKRSVHSELPRNYLYTELRRILKNKHAKGSSNTATAGCVCVCKLQSGLRRRLMPSQRKQRSSTCPLRASALMSHELFTLLITFPARALSPEARRDDAHSVLTNWGSKTC